MRRLMPAPTRKRRPGKSKYATPFGNTSVTPNSTRTTGQALQVCRRAARTMTEGWKGTVTVTVTCTPHQNLAAEARLRDRRHRAIRILRQARFLAAGNDVRLISAERD